MHTTPSAHPLYRASRRSCLGICVAAAALLAGCSLFPSTTDKGMAPGTDGTPSTTAPTGGASVGRQITMQTPLVKSYRKEGARHVYKDYPKRIYKGKIPPLVYAVVVAETELDAKGNVTAVNFSRTPSHAPEVPPLIAKLIKDASPFPAPTRIGAHTYVDTWLWDKSGRFQLDSITEGQRSR